MFVDWTVLDSVNFDLTEFSVVGDRGILVDRKSVTEVGDVDIILDVISKEGEVIFLV